MSIGPQGAKLMIRPGEISSEHNKRKRNRQTETMLSKIYGVYGCRVFMCKPL